MKAKKLPVSAATKETIHKVWNINLTVPSKLSIPEKEVLYAKRSLISNRVDTYTGLVNTSREQLDIKISPKNLVEAKALRFPDKKNF